MPNGRTLIFGGDARSGVVSTTVEEYDLATNRDDQAADEREQGGGQLPTLARDAGRADVQERADPSVRDLRPRHEHLGQFRLDALRATDIAGYRSSCRGCARRVLTVGGRPGGSVLRRSRRRSSTSSPPHRGLAQSTGSMSRARQLANAVVLPDGKVFVVGGGAQPSYSGPVLTPSSSTQTRAWTRMQPHQASRMYHSTALLLPDGRVFCAGQDNGPLANFAEIWSPPYLFRGRSAHRHGGTGDDRLQPGLRRFTRRRRGTSTWVTVIRSGSVTHQVNTDQRSVAAELYRPARRDAHGHLATERQLGSARLLLAASS